jgi:TRAP-type C4-dicarboxylate transport system substrate-binding protein
LKSIDVGLAPTWPAFGPIPQRFSTEELATLQRGLCRVTPSVPAIRAIVVVKMGKLMFQLLARYALLSLALLPAAGVASVAWAAEPVELKLAFFTSDRSSTYLAAVKPFVDAVNSDGRGLVQIVLYVGGVLGREIAQQPDVVINGKADIAFVVPGYTPERFPDNVVVELPGLFRDTREATLVYTRLIALNALKGYEDFTVLGAYVSGPETIHSRLPITSIDDLKGKKIRVNNLSEAKALERLGALPVRIQITQVASALGSGAIDAAMVSLTPLADYGIKRVAAYHYFLGTSGAPLALVMNRKKFEGLPAPVQDLIRKYSGKWAADRFIESYDRSDAIVLDELKSDPKRKVVFPSSSDLDRAQDVYQSVIADWVGADPRNQELINLTEKELASVRAMH